MWGKAAPKSQGQRFSMWRSRTARCQALPAQRSRWAGSARVPSPRWGGGLASAEGAGPEIRASRTSDLDESLCQRLF